MLVAVRYLGNDTMTGINQIEDWYLPKGAFKTSFEDTAGRTLYLVGTADQIKAEVKKMDVKDASMHHYGHTFKLKGHIGHKHHHHVASSVAAPAPAAKKPDAKKK